MGLLDGYKTYLMAIAAFMIAAGTTIVNYYNGTPLEIDVLIEAFIALALLFLRKSQKSAA